MSNHRLFQSKRSPRYLKEERDGKRWVVSCSFSLVDFVNDNRHDEHVIDEVLPRLASLRVGDNFVHHGGAGGDDRFTRVS